jgi:hypothetical protein
MTRVALPVLVALVAACSRPKPPTTTAPPQAPDKPAAAAAPKKSLPTFQTEDAFASWVKDKVAQDKRRAAARGKGGDSPDPAPAASAAADSLTDTKQEGEESITNTQHANVDEGGIVKVHGDHLVVLRRGRIFTVKVGDGALAPVSSIDAFGPGIDPASAWYDEMLVSRDTVVVVGYSYQRGGTEIGLFDIDKAGQLAYRATYHLRSNDYYSARNYASRVIGDKLVFYSPGYLNLHDKDPFRGFPSVRRWHNGANEAEFKRIVEPSRIYRPLEGMSATALHSVTVCDLSQRDMPCSATSVLGPWGRVFYVSESAVYVWTTDYSYDGRTSHQKSAIYRMPLDGSEVQALRTVGAPVDQFSFDEEDGNLDVVLRAEGAGDAMWASEVTAGDVGLVRIPLATFGDGQDEVDHARYARLPRPAGHAFQNRFIGKWLLYGTGNGWGYAKDKQKEQQPLFAYRYARGDGEATKVLLPHGIDRIEAMGKDAVVVGSDGTDLHFSSIALGDAPRSAGDFVQRGASQGELRSHGFFYKPDGDDAGTIGLPIRSDRQPGWSHLVEGSASVVFVRNQGLTLSPLGELEARPGVGQNDGCRASCVDWYGNARPIFLRGRVFALMGYEIVEGRRDDGRIQEVRRVSFAPR